MLILFFFQKNSRFFTRFFFFVTDFSLVQIITIRNPDAHRIMHEKFNNACQNILYCNNKATGSFNLRPEYRNRQVFFCLF